MMKIKLLFTGILLVASSQLFAQQGELKACITDEMDRERISQDPGVLQVRAQLEAAMQVWLQNNPHAPMQSGNIIIPVVFHILHNYGPENISDAQVIDQVRIWNEDYQKRNADITDVIPPFQARASSCGMEFRLATKDPYGNCTNGIEHIATMNTYNAVDNSKRAVGIYPTGWWPNGQYLNIWTVSSLAQSGAAAYAYYPPNSCPGCGVISISSYIGSIGTGNYGTARIISHETGHCFNLQHVWGNNNNAGQTCGDDGVADTPITKGWLNCPAATAPNYTQWIVCTPNVIENVQNFMEYSYCARMFTAGQASRMASALSTASNLVSLYTTTNLTNTGTIDPYNYDSLLTEVCVPTPRAEFTASSQFVCAGNSVTFSDYTWNAPSGSWTYSWTFAGGTPSTSTAAHPIIQYNTPGTYDVALTATTAGGSNTRTKTGYIIVAVATPGSVPAVEDFEASSFPPPGGSVINPTAGNTWQWATTGALSSSHSMEIVNWSGNTAGAIDEYITPSYDFSNVTSPTVTFYLAYTHRYSDTTLDDALKVYYSLDCGLTWTQRYTKPASLVTTTPRYSTSSFFPSASQWVQQNVPVSAIHNKPNVRFKFQSVSAGGNNLFVDKINISGIVGVNELENTISAFDVFPNPTQNNSTIELTLEKNSDVKMELFDLTGRKISSIVNSRLTEGTYHFLLNQPLQGGVYFIQLTSGALTTAKRLVVLQ